jgi:hypothetical protein
MRGPMKAGPYRKKESDLATWGWGLLAGALVVAVALFLSPTEVADACDGLAWPFLVGKWEPVAAKTATTTPSSQTQLQLFLYPGGEAIKDGQKGHWRIVTCGGPTVIIDLPRRLQTNSCDLSVEDIFKPDLVTGTLTCSGKSIEVHRTETRGLVASTLLEDAIKSREEAAQFERDMERAPAWKKAFVRIMQILG